MQPGYRSYLSRYEDGELDRRPDAGRRLGSPMPQGAIRQADVV